MAAVVAVIVACAQKTPEELLELAASAMRQGDLSTASIHVRNLLQADPENADARLMLAQVAIGLGDPASAEAAVRRAMESGAANARSQLLLLRALGMQGKFQEVIDRHNAISTWPDAAAEAEALGIAGGARHGLGNLAEAEADLRRAVELNPSSTDYRAQLAAVLVDAGAPDEALSVIGSVLADEPMHVRALALRARIETSSGLFAAAEATLKTALEAARSTSGSTTVEVLVQLIDAQVSQGKLDDAAANADAVVRAAPTHPLARYSKAVVSLKQGKTDEAEQLLAALVSEAPNMWLAVRLLAVIDAQQGQLGQAEAGLQSVLSNNPGDAATRVQLADVYVRQGNLARARQLFEGTPAAEQSDSVFLAAVGAASAQVRGDDLASDSYLSGLAPTQSVAQLLNLVGILVSAGEFDRAVAAIGDAQLQTAEEVLAGQSLLAAVHVAARNLDAAREVADRLIAENPRLPWVYTLRANVALRAEQTDVAREMLDRALELDGRHLQALLARAALDARAGSLQSAEGFWKRAIAVDPANAQALYGLAQLALGQNDLPLARSWLERAPESPQRTELIGRVDFAAGNLTEAAAAFARAFEAQPSSARAIQFYQASSRAGQPNPEQYLVTWLRQNPLDVPANMLLAAAATTAGNASEAINRYERVVNVEPQNAVALNNLAWLYSESGDSRALETAERARAAAPDNPAILDTLGWFLVRSGDHARAVELLEQAASAPGSVPEIRYHFGVALAENGQTERAVEVLERVLAENATFTDRQAAEQRLQSLRNAGRR